MKSVQPNKSPRERREALLAEKRASSCTVESIVGCPPSVTPAMLDAAGETDWWWCPSCGVQVQPEHVTFEETHDPRCGGCGKPVWPESEVDHTPNAGREARAGASRPPRHCWRFSCGRMHEECEGCALQNVEPPQCEGHPQGPVACERFERRTAERLSDPCPSYGEDGDIHG